MRLNYKDGTSLAGPNSLATTQDAFSWSADATSALNGTLLSLAEQSLDSSEESNSYYEWALLSEMTFTEQCFSFFGVVLVMALLPLLILLVLKSEGK